MSTMTEQPSFAAPDSSLPLPDPGERVPTLSWPIVGIFTLSLAVFAGTSVAAVNHAAPAAATIAASSVAIFMMFTVLHDASHYSISSHRWVNIAFGRVAMLFVSPLISFSAFAFIHIEHHRNTNDDDSDPDHFVSAATYWQLPFRFPIMDLPYLSCLARNIKRRPRSEIAETAFLMSATVIAIAAAAVSGHLWMFAVVYLIPSRVAMFVLAWWFDWLPHHDLDDTPRENRYRTTRNRMGSEWILTPLLLSQNYHLVHHLHPSIPFYRYVAAWRRNEDAYLERGAAIGTVFGQQLDPREYREWKQLNGKTIPLLPIRRIHTTGAGTRTTHPLTVSGIEQLTYNSVRVTFEIPDSLREEFRFQPGQHITIHHRIDGQPVCRSYSICTSTTSGVLAIGIRKVDGGTFSTYAVDNLRVGDVLEVEPPTGTFGAPRESVTSDHHVAVAAGSGITPILSLVATTLETTPNSRFTLYYGNRSAESTMFATELYELATHYPERLRVFHIRSNEPDHPEILSGRINTPLIVKLLDADVTSIGTWYLCGPTDLVTSVRSDLLADGVPSEQVHVELFGGATRAAQAGDEIESTVSIKLSGADHQLTSTRGSSVLEAALASNINVPYSCLGGACGTCRAKVTSGSVSMDQNLALSETEVKQGFVLTCQSHPTTDTVAVDYDSRPA